ncbi:MAG: MBOAT family O-acyltransferase [Rhodoferax sp.]|uniref:MBOAT family O-acyltransferase n=1 Tax=Rhodoferax sp. TaxID=50421 RepID=UPI00271B701D|nr:MBOAT family O-acyltransferase [Rhodoferax sp.]MDO8450869.1 MBOAT family O-acyltransferase [Rhodoferax sp.]
MLFTTAVFACLFLPLVLAGFFIAARISHSAAATWLFGASLFFYGYWMPEFTLLLIGSIVGNFFVGTRIGRTPRATAKHWLVAGLAANLMLLAYFKYANFFVDNLNAMVGFNWNVGRVLLPVGISFFTFTQIAFLADAYQKGVREYKFIHYGLFVTYFPHLIAGPVLHHSQMMPQFDDAQTYRWNTAQVAGGLAIFAIGLFKKVVLADGISPYADAVFKPAETGLSPDLHEAWLGALAYTFQIYFDFSGYSDMAVGLSWLFNVRLPFNFNSPYRATNISDFWRRWHMSLSTFLRDYLYIALGGNRYGPARRYANLAITMVLGGLWHGANWTFVFWGGLHGLYLVLNHGFRALCGKTLLGRLSRSPIFLVLTWMLTMLSVIVAWVFFRAETFSGAWRMLRGMAGENLTGQVHPLLWNAGMQFSTGARWCFVLGVIAFLAPNSNRIGTRVLDLCRIHTTARAWVGGAALAASLFLVLMNTARDSVSAFIYFNF